jgi:hypothetical protein
VNISGASDTLVSMAKSSRKTAKSRARRSVLLPTPNKDLSLRVKGRAAMQPPPKRRDISGTIIAETSRALSRPGISRKAVFTGTSVESYSVDPANPRQFIRERADGTKTIGRLVNGQFRPLSAR